MNGNIKELELQFLMCYAWGDTIDASGYKKII